MLARIISLPLASYCTACDGTASPAGSLIQHPEHAPEEAARQEQWLREQLSAARQANVQKVVVFQHIPFFIYDADEPDGYFNIPKATRAKYLDILGSAGVQYVFPGHLHYAATAESGPVYMISAGPVGKPLGSGASGLRVVRVSAGGLEERWFDFGHFPMTIESAFSAARK
jgi:serine/threonine-protein phosphatase CPPED1